MHPIFAAALLAAPIPMTVGAIQLAPAPAGPEAALYEQTIYIVQPGDTLTAIATAHDRTVAALALTNRIIDVDAIAVGQVLVIPPPAPRDATLHVVKAGDTLNGIGALYGVDPDALAAANDLTLDTLIFPGDVLIVP
jgi:LysM repeat protein